MFRRPLVILLLAIVGRAGSLPSGSSLRGNHDEELHRNDAAASATTTTTSSDSIVFATVLSSDVGERASELYMFDGEEEDLLSDEELMYLEQLDNVLIPEQNEIDVDGNDQHQRMLLSVTTPELQNAGYIQSTRVANGKQKVAWGTDVLAEAQRWSRRMARVQAVSYRSPITRNITAGWRKLSELDGSDFSVAYTGMFSQFMRSNRSKTVILDNAYNRLGVGITKNGTKYYVCYIFKAVLVT